MLFTDFFDFMYSKNTVAIIWLIFVNWITIDVFLTKVRETHRWWELKKYDENKVKYLQHRSHLSNRIFLGFHALALDIPRMNY